MSSFATIVVSLWDSLSLKRVQQGNEYVSVNWRNINSLELFLISFTISVSVTPVAVLTMTQLINRFLENKSSKSLLPLLDNFFLSCWTGMLQLIFNSVDLRFALPRTTYTCKLWFSWSEDNWTNFQSNLTDFLIVAIADI